MPPELSWNFRPNTFKDNGSGILLQANRPKRWNFVNKRRGSVFSLYDRVKVVMS